MIQRGTNTGPGKIRGLVELSPEMDRFLLHRLLSAAHLVSGRGRILLVVKGTPFDDTMLRQARHAEFVIAESEELSAFLLHNAVLHMRAREGIQYLKSLATLDEAVITPDVPHLTVLA